MKAFFAALAGLLFAGSTWAQIPGLGDMLKGIANPGQPGATVGAGDERTNSAGIKEALAVAHREGAVNDLSQMDGYFGNQAVKILMPESIRKVADVARLVGFEKQVDEFVAQMNRAAEAAAPTGGAVLRRRHPRRCRWTTCAASSPAATPPRPSSSAARRRTSSTPRSSRWWPRR